ncbi:N-alpha-acetyltransferase 40-like [Branchiostoma floridae x Branchiostoma japonicum]
MGRKSNKGKEKKKRRKEEQAKLAASFTLVEAANKQEDPMATMAPFKKYERNGLNLAIECKKVAELDKDTVDWAFSITKDNMQTLYEESNWGWNDRLKKEELTEDKAWYLVARDQEGQPIAFSHFRFDMDEDEEVLYCYEIQLTKTARRKGLGKFMMQILQLLANKAQMLKVMVTVFKMNTESRDFFLKALKFELDETDPGLCDPMEADEYCYEILSKKTVLGVKKQQEGDQCCSGSGCSRNQPH